MLIRARAWFTWKWDESLIMNCLGSASFCNRKCTKLKYRSRWHVQLSCEIFINIRPINSGEDLSPPSSRKIPNKIDVLSVVSEIKHEKIQKDMPSLCTHSVRRVDYGTKWNWGHLIVFYHSTEQFFINTVRQYVWIYLGNRNLLRFQEKSEFHEKSLNSMTLTFRKDRYGVKKHLMQWPGAATYYIFDNTDDSNIRSPAAIFRPCLHLLVCLRTEH
jgi:hypothetical protein